jgi:hypothetical protein
LVQQAINPLGVKVVVSVLLKKLQHQHTRARGAQTGSLKISVNVHGLEEWDVRKLSSCVSRANCNLPNYVRRRLKGPLRTRLPADSNCRTRTRNHDPATRTPTTLPA